MQMMKVSLCGDLDPDVVVSLAGLQPNPWYAELRTRLGTFRYLDLLLQLLAALTFCLFANGNDDQIGYNRLPALQDGGDNTEAKVICFSQASRIFTFTCQ